MPSNEYINLIEIINKNPKIKMLNIHIIQKEKKHILIKIKYLFFERLILKL